MGANSGLSLDPATLLFAISMFGFLMAGTALSMSSSMPSHKGALVEWSKAMTAAGFAFLLYFFRGHAPLLLTFLLANILVTLTAAYGHFAFAMLLEIPTRKTNVGVIGLLGLSGVMASQFFGAPRVLAVFSVSAGLSVVLGMTALQIFRNLQAQGKAVAVVAASVTGLLSAAFAMRAAISMLGDASDVSPASSSTAQVSSLLTGALFIIASSVAFFSVVHERQRTGILERARRDALTGVLTRGAFFELADELAGQAQPCAYGIVMLDIDLFKRINDTFGHSGGDVTLAHAARLIASAVRLSDAVGRYGGEEFCVLLRDCSQKQVADLAQRFVVDAGLQSVRLPDGRMVRYTLSAGYATAESGSPSEAFGSVIERADKALYLAKRGGRNQALPAPLPLGVALVTQ